MFKSLSLKVIIFGFIFTCVGNDNDLRDALSISHGQFGSIYASATLLSSFVLVWVGKKIDDVDVIKFASYVIIFLAVSCFIFSKISSVIFLFFGIFLMRLAGQGLSSHTATTTISRFFEKNRGRALSTSWLGLSLAEFVMPVLIVFLLTFIEWRDIWVSISILVIVVLPIATFILVKQVKLDTREETKIKESNKKIKQWRRIEVLKDYRFYIICITMLAMPWIATGSFVYQSFISSSKEWGPYVIAQSFMVYSILSVITLFVSGFLIDKFSSRKLLIYMNIPLFFGTIVLYYFDVAFSSFVFFGLLGMTNGLANVLGSSTWAEIYGVKYIGSIKALTTALMVFSTAFGTALFGFLIDIGFSIEEIAVVSGTYIFGSIILLYFVKNKLNPHYL